MKHLVAILLTGTLCAQTLVEPVVSKTETAEVTTQTRLVRVDVIVHDPASVRFLSTHATERLIDGVAVGETRTVSEKLVTRDRADAVTVGGVTLTRAELVAFLAAFAEADRGAPKVVSSNVLRWQDNSVNEAGFEVWRSNNGILFAQIATVPRNVTTFTDSQPGPAHYRVRAINSAGASEYSNVATR